MLRLMMPHASRSSTPHAATHSAGPDSYLSGHGGAQPPLRIGLIDISL
jgi:hypothetical protein